VTSWLAHYGVAAIFILMLIDAVFPAASELVMVYGGVYVAHVFATSDVGTSDIAVPFAFRRS